jgi:hypothetical protein
MQRWLTILLGTLAVGLALVVAYRSAAERPAPTHDVLLRDAEAPDAPADAAEDATGKTTDLFADLSGSLGASDPRAGEMGAGWRLPDGRPVPPLPPSSPRQVRLGVVLMTFAGTQGAPPGARSKSEALGLAQKLASDAKTDFHAAVVRGDGGSADDVGHIPRGVLELGTEYVAFTMAVGSVSDPLETPRGYWIIKRLD